MTRPLSVAQSEEHIAKYQKWSALNWMQRYEIMQKVEAKRGKKYKTLSAGLNAFLKLV